MNEGKPVKAEPKAVKPEVPTVSKPSEPAGHKYPLWLYHPEHAPEGRLCKESEHHKGEGWVDTPAKFQKAPKA